MGKFFGTYSRTLDEKKRLQIPSKLVKEMPHSFYVLRGFEGCLSIYEEAEFNVLMAKLESLSYTSETARNYVRLSSASVEELDVDSHGRITLPKELADAYKIGNDVVLIGVLDHFELWDQNAYAAYLKEKSPLYENLAEGSQK
ncbi:MAG: division/cell wall cluster transcriptional repressor MraZ [Bacilli bacterium]